MRRTGARYARLRIIASTAALRRDVSTFAAMADDAAGASWEEQKAKWGARGSRGCAHLCPGRGCLADGRTGRRALEDVGGGGRPRTRSSAALAAARGEGAAAREPRGGLAREPAAPQRAGGELLHRRRARARREAPTPQRSEQDLVAACGSSASQTKPRSDVAPPSRAGSTACP